MSLNINMEKHEALMQRRVDTMRETCDHYGDDIIYPKRVFANHSLMWDTDHQLVYCPIYKVSDNS